VKVADGPATAATTVYMRLPVLSDAALGGVRSVWTVDGLGDKASAWEVVVFDGGPGVGSYWFTIDPLAHPADELDTGEHVELGQGVTGTVDTRCAMTRVVWNLGRFGYDVEGPGDTFPAAAAERVARRLVVAITRGETVGTLVTRDADLRAP
jgi:hypothetical protein